MKNSDFGKFKEVLIGLGEIYDRPISRTLAQLYWNALKDLDIEQFSDAATKHTLDPKAGSFFPKPADLMRHICESKEVSLSDRAKAGWASVVTHLKNAGAYRNFKAEDRAVMAALNAIGGIKALSTIDYREMQWYEKRFFEHYESFSRTPPERLPSVSYGLEDLSKQEQQAQKNIARLLGEAAKVLEENEAPRLETGEKSDKNIY